MGPGLWPSKTSCLRKLDNHLANYQGCSGARCNPGAAPQAGMGPGLWPSKTSCLCKLDNHLANYQGSTESNGARLAIFT